MGNALGFPLKCFWLCQSNATGYNQYIGHCFVTVLPVKTLAMLKECQNFKQDAISIFTHAIVLKNLLSTKTFSASKTQVYTIAKIPIVS